MALFRRPVSSASEPSRWPDRPNEIRLWPPVTVRSAACMRVRSDSRPESLASGPAGTGGVALGSPWVVSASSAVLSLL